MKDRKANVKSQPVELKEGRGAHLQLCLDFGVCFRFLFDKEEALAFDSIFSLRKGKLWLPVSKT